jgi:hypothetical protein
MPLPGEDNVRVTGAAAIASVTGPVKLAIGLLESVALTVRIAVPEAVGVPLIAQPEDVRPAGRVPGVIVQE